MSIYYDIKLGHFSDSFEDLPLIINEVRSSSFIKKANEYKMAITRFQFDSINLPVFRCNLNFC